MAGEFTGRQGSGPPAPGSRLAGYVLEEQIGAGGMAIVFRARDEMLGRLAAVKVIAPAMAGDAEFRARFLRESRAIAAVEEPHIIPVYAAGEADGVLYIATRYVAGGDLVGLLQRAGGILQPDQAADLVTQVAAALDAAHAAGLVHRDITPANIMLAGEHVKILDFGIARADGTAAGTLTGTILGTAAYLSPEQSAGYPAGPQSDLYSLGCVLFEMLAGTPPFTAESPVGVAYRQVHDDPGPPSARRPGLSPSLDAITARLLAKNPNDRPMTAAAARTGLLAALDPGGTAVLPVPPGSVPDTARQRRRLRWSETVLAVTLAAALLALTVTLLIGGGSASPAAPPAARDSQASQPPAAPTATSTTSTTSALPPVATAAAALVGDLQAGVSDGQVSQQAGQNMFNQLQQLLFAPPGQGAQQTQNQYDQLAQAYTQYKSQGDITGAAAVVMPKAISALGDALGVL